MPNLLGRTLAAVARVDIGDVKIDAVVSLRCPHVASVLRQVEALPAVTLHQDLPSLAPLMIKADLAIGAGGATTWERLCVGLPSVVATVADNQEPIAKELHRLGLIKWLGDGRELDEAQIASSLESVIQQELDEDWSRRCALVVDGRGTDRVCEAMAQAHYFPLHVRRAVRSDEQLLLDWANNELVRQNALNPAPISASSHHLWFHRRMENIETTRLFIVETKNRLPLGQVRFELVGEAWEVHYSLSAAFRGRGLGKELLDAAMAGLHAEFENAVVFGKVKADNKASCRIFDALGFEERTGGADGVVEYLRNSTL